MKKGEFPEGGPGRIIGILCASALSLPGNALAADHYVELAIGHSSGTYGTAVSTKLTRWVVNAGVLKTHLFATLSVPYLSMNTEGDPAQQGLGDILATAGYRTERSDGGLSATCTVSVKFPTAEASNSLGSGETDTGVFSTVNKQWDDFIGSIGAGYIFVGNPPGGDYKNMSQFAVSLFKRFRSVGANVYLNYHSPSLEGADIAVESGVAAYYVVSSHIGITGDGYAGLTEGSPDYGFQLGVLRWF